MKIIIILSLLSMTLTIHAQDRKDKLTQILREECLYIPKIIPEAEMIEGIHFTKESWETNCDYQGLDCDRHYYKSFKHLYYVVHHWEWWTADGRLATKTETRTKLEIGTTRYAEYPKEVAKLIYSSRYPVCADSPVKN